MSICRPLIISSSMENLGRVDEAVVAAATWGTGRAPGVAILYKNLSYILRKI